SPDRALGQVVQPHRGMDEDVVEPAVLVQVEWKVVGVVMTARQRLPRPRITARQGCAFRCPLAQETDQRLMQQLGLGETAREEREHIAARRIGGQRQERRLNGASRTSPPY